MFVFMQIKVETLVYAAGKIMTMCKIKKSEFLDQWILEQKLYNVLIIMVILLKKKKDFTFMRQQIQVFSTC